MPDDSDLPDDKMEHYYKLNDWESISGGRPEGYITVKGRRVPFAVLNNEPEVTADVKKLAPALRDTIMRLRSLL